MSNEIQVNKKSGLDMFDIFVLIAFSYNSVMVYFSAVFARLPIINVIGYEIVPWFVSFFAVICFVAGYFRGVKVSDFLFILLFLFTILLSYVFHQETHGYFTQSNLRSIYVEAIPFFLLAVCFRCNQRTLKNLTYISYVAIIINILYMFLIVGLTSEDGEYYMGQAYMLLPHVMFAINSIFDRTVICKRIISISFSLLGIFFLLAMGTRGPLLIAIIYFAIKIFLAIDKRKPKTIVMFTIFAIALFGIIASGYYLVLFEKLANTLSRYGMSTRIIDMLLENEYLSHTSGRDKIYELLLQKIVEKPIFGYGIFGEEQFHVFAHNIALEIIMYYGIPVGVTIIIAYIVTALRAYFKSNNKYAKDLILLFFVMTVVHAPFGGSHLSYYFFFLLGLSISELRNVKNKHINYYKNKGELE